MREPNTQYILSLSYGKDSLACLEAIHLLGLPLDRIVHAELWATDTIPADLPPMVDFKQKADRIIKERYGITVEHICATREREREERLSYEKQFYTLRYSKERQNYSLYGFPVRKGQWCTSKLKTEVLTKFFNQSNIRNVVLRDTDQNNQEQSFSRRNSRLPDTSDAVVQLPIENTTIKQGAFSQCPKHKGQKTNIVQYLGIAADEPERIERHTKQGIVLPLVELGWDEQMCRKWCEENDLLSPIYTTATRGGCWFCHNQGVEQLRLLRKDYPEYWQLMLKWDNDSPVTFHPDGHTVHDFEKRFAAEDKGLITAGDTKFRWKQVL